ACEGLFVIARSLPRSAGAPIHSAGRDSPPAKKSQPSSRRAPACAAEVLQQGAERAQRLFEDLGLGNRQLQISLSGLLVAGNEAKPRPGARVGLSCRCRRPRRGGELLK